MEGESREMLKIGDIYAGKPDAGDEIKECGYEEFANIFIHPTGVNIGRLASTKYGTPFFIMGDKGTGKTALLHFLEKQVYTAFLTALKHHFGKTQKRAKLWW